ncbi:sulfurtransferase TusA family protein [Streptomyces sp. NPDC001410]|uniref:sulfurtransferase TusA family protein n=1 Tax=Streptomyces sp. NPDC001410 TaxID=3364574 RepID=UPI00369242CD
MTADVSPAPALTVDGTGLLCVTLLLRLRKAIDGADPGSVVHVIATDPAAPLDLPAWCHLTSHTYLGPVPAPPGRPTPSASPPPPGPPAPTHRGTGPTGATGATEPEPCGL